MLQKGWPDFSFAFQPIVHATERRIISYEALVRGRNGESAQQILQAVSSQDSYHFDEVLRLEAIALAAKLNLPGRLNLNLLPRSLEVTETAIGSTLSMAHKHGIPYTNIAIEIIESEIISDLDWFIKSVNEFRARGVHLSIDDFGAGFSGLNLLAKFQPDSIKIDMSLIRDIHTSGPKQAIVRGIIRTCMDLGIDVIAEGVETQDEYWWCMDEEIELYQGFLIAKPGYEHFPEVLFPVC